MPLISSTRTWSTMELTGDLSLTGDGKEAVFNRFYFADCEKALDEITSGEPGRVYKEQDIDSRLEQILCYYDNAFAR